MCQICGLVAYWFEHCVYFCTNTNLGRWQERFRICALLISRFGNTKVDGEAHLEGLAGLKELKVWTMPWLVFYATTWLHVLFTSFPDPGSTKFALPRKRLTLQPGMSYAIRAQPRQATNTAVRAELCYIIVSDRRHLATSTHIFGLHEHVPLEKYWKVSNIGPAMAWATVPAPSAL